PAVAPALKQLDAEIPTGPSSAATDQSVAALSIAQVESVIDEMVVDLQPAGTDAFAPIEAAVDDSAASAVRAPSELKAVTAALSAPTSSGEPDSPMSGRPSAERVMP